jgi:uncharacterized protein YutE (UPF0331/DUF86 family)/predicted nucleotidyltransferase
MKKDIQRLKKYFSSQDDVVFAFLFGSQASKRAGRISDWDIGVYFRPVKERIEWEEQGRLYPQEDKIWNDCIDILTSDNVDLVVLNRVPASIASSCIQGIPLIIKDKKLFTEFMLIVSSEAEDYRKFVDDYYIVSQRSNSITPQEREYLEKNILFLEEQMLLYSYFSNFSQKEYENDIHKRNDVERWAENMVNAAIDISKIILASQKKPVPQTYRDTIRQSIWLLKLPEDFIEKFQIWVKFRNIIAHEYLDIKWERISDFIQNSKSYFVDFIKKVKENCGV